MEKVLINSICPNNEIGDANIVLGISNHKLIVRVETKDGHSWVAACDIELARKYLKSVN